MTNEARLARALTVTPGASQTRSKGPGQVGPRDTTLDYPLFAAHGDGAYLWDHRGRKYIDCFGANAAIPLGYNHPAVRAAVHDALVHGPLLSLPSRMECEISERFLALCAPWAAQVRWVKTGSEAVSAAVRIARRATGRDVVLVASDGYHGWHDWFAGRRLVDGAGPNVGVPRAPYVAEFRSGDIDHLALMCLTYRQSYGAIAAIVIEPTRWVAMDVDYLKAVVRIAHEQGAVVVFDEMVYGLRWRHGGGAEYYGVAPDLACFGKALGNGVPVACVCGTADVMAYAVDAGISGTYGGDTLGLAAAGAVLTTYEQQDVIEQLWASGRELWCGFAETRPQEARLDGFFVHWRLLLPSDALLDATLLKAAAAGVLVHRASNNASAAMLATVARRAGHILGIVAAAAVARAPDSEAVS